MPETVGIDASGLFAFFQMQEPGLRISNLKISSRLKSYYYEFLVNNIILVIPVPALSELMYKTFNKGKAIEFNKLLVNYETLDNVVIANWDVNVLKEMSAYLAHNEIKTNQYFKKVKKKPELFDLAIYH